MNDSKDEVLETNGPERGLSDSSVVGAQLKTCCSCGMDLSGRTRYKDSHGRYWCPNCNQKDEMKKQPATCPDCSGQFTRADLIEFMGTPVCSACWEKRKVSAKRDEARIRRVEEDEEEKRQTTRRVKKLLIGGQWIVVLWAILMGIIFLIRWLA
jgi:hypothetical protein